MVKLDYIELFLGNIKVSKRKYLVPFNFVCNVN